MKRRLDSKGKKYTQENLFFSSKGGLFSISLCQIPFFVLVFSSPFRYKADQNVFRSFLPRGERVRGERRLLMHKMLVFVSNSSTTSDTASISDLTDRRTDGWMDGLMDGWMDGKKNMSASAAHGRNNTSPLYKG
jgi:hypothetical protein